jgi:hypothetical protein
MGRLKNDAIASEDRRRKVTTLGDVATAGHNVFCWCNRCGHNSEVDAQVLIARLGPAIPVPEIGPRMRCSGCGSKDVATRPAWPSQGPVAGHVATGGDDAA